MVGQPTILRHACKGKEANGSNPRAQGQDRFPELHIVSTGGRTSEPEKPSQALLPPEPSTAPCPFSSEVLPQIILD